MHPALKNIESQRVWEKYLPGWAIQILHVRFRTQFSFFRSTQILGFPMFFSTGTTGALHSLGSVTHSIIPAHLPHSVPVSEGKQFFWLGWYLKGQHSHVIFTGSQFNRLVSPNRFASSSSFLATRPVVNCPRTVIHLLDWQELLEMMEVT